MRNYPKDTGVPNSVESKKGGSGQNGGVVIEAPGAGKHIIITDILSASNGSLLEGAGGATFAYAVGGVCNLRAPIKVKENTAVATSNISYITINYYIEG